MAKAGSRPYRLTAAGSPTALAGQGSVHAWTWQAVTTQQDARPEPGQ